jgi:hypothetical protein
MIPCPDCQEVAVKQNIYAVKEEHREILGRFEDVMVFFEEAYIPGNVVFFCTDCDFASSNGAFFHNLFDN